MATLSEYAQEDILHLSAEGSDERSEGNGLIHSPVEVSDALSSSESDYAPAKEDYGKVFLWSEEEEEIEEQEQEETWQENEKEYDRQYQAVTEAAGFRVPTAPDMAAPVHRDMDAFPNMDSTSGEDETEEPISVEPLTANRPPRERRLTSASNISYQESEESEEEAVKDEQYLEVVSKSGYRLPDMLVAVSRPKDVLPNLDDVGSSGDEEEDKQPLEEMDGKLTRTRGVELQSTEKENTGPEEEEHGDVTDTSSEMDHEVRPPPHPKSANSVSGLLLLASALGGGGRGVISKTKPFHRTPRDTAEARAMVGRILARIQRSARMSEGKVAYNADDVQALAELLLNSRSSKQPDKPQEEEEEESRSGSFSSGGDTPVIAPSSEFLTGPMLDDVAEQGIVFAQSPGQEDEATTPIMMPNGDLIATAAANGMFVPDGMWTQPPQQQEDVFGSTVLHHLGSGRMNSNSRDSSLDRASGTLLAQLRSALASVSANDPIAAAKLRSQRIMNEGDREQRPSPPVAALPPSPRRHRPPSAPASATHWTEQEEKATPVMYPVDGPGSEGTTPRASSQETTPRQEGWSSSDANEWILNSQYHKAFLHQAELVEQLEPFPHTDHLSAEHMSKHREIVKRIQRRIKEDEKAGLVPLEKTSKGTMSSILEELKEEAVPLPGRSRLYYSPPIESPPPQRYSRMHPQESALRSVLNKVALARADRAQVRQGGVRPRITWQQHRQRLLGNQRLPRDMAPFPSQSRRRRRRRRRKTSISAQSTSTAPSRQKKQWVRKSIKIGTLMPPRDALPPPPEEVRRRQVVEDNVRAKLLVQSMMRSGMRERARKRARAKQRRQSRRGRRFSVPVLREKPPPPSSVSTKQLSSVGSLGPSPRHPPQGLLGSTQAAPVGKVMEDDKKTPTLYPDLGQMLYDRMMANATFQQAREKNSNVMDVQKVMELEKDALWLGESHAFDDGEASDRTEETAATDDTVGMSEI